MDTFHNKRKVPINDQKPREGLFDTIDQYILLRLIHEKLNFK